MAWRELLLSVDARHVARAEALLELMGAISVAEHDAGDFPVLEPAPGQAPSWPVTGLRALFEADVDIERAADLLRDALGAPLDMHVRDVGDEWQRGWMQRVEARRFGRIELVPADEPGSLGAHAVRLRMGFAFGTGEHPTTGLCLEWLDDQVRMGMRVLDYGCGSGVLALAALALGAGCAYAVDNDPQALEATAANAALNGASALWVGAPEALPDVEVDLLVANILAGPLVHLARYFARLTVPNAPIALSGILESQLDTVEQAYHPYFTRFERETKDGWARLTARRQCAKP